MVIVKLIGGLGNQMFQYGLAKSLAAHLNTNFKFDLDFLLDRTPKENFTYRDYNLDIFKLKAERTTKQDTWKYMRQPSKNVFLKYLEIAENKIFPRTYFFEPHYHFAAQVFDLPRNCYLEGYWQSPKYFNNVEDELRKDFSFREDLPTFVTDLTKKILNSNSICIHVRRTDYLNSSFHPICDMKYFTPAIGIMASKIENPEFFVFSDDPAWCVENFKLTFPVTVVGDKYKGLKFADDLHLMSLCKHFIIPNSSFSWWATWLNSDKNKLVVAPTTWFADPKWDSKDLIPENWLRVDN